jgi:hypothetical protein
VLERILGCESWSRKRLVDVMIITLTRARLLMDTISEQRAKSMMEFWDSEKEQQRCAMK